MNEIKLSPLLQRFFTDRLFKQLDASAWRLKQWL